MIWRFGAVHLSVGMLFQTVVQGALGLFNHELHLVGADTAHSSGSCQVPTRYVLALAVHDRAVFAVYAGQEVMS